MKTKFFTSRRGSSIAAGLFALSAALTTGAGSPEESALATAPRRVLELRVPSVRDAIFERQAALVLPHWRGLIERDLDVITLEGSAAFEVRLIGKDGGEKLRSATPVTMTAVFALIDSMPMRQAEMERARRK